MDIETETRKTLASFMRLYGTLDATGEPVREIHCRDCFDQRYVVGRPMDAAYKLIVSGWKTGLVYDDINGRNVLAPICPKCRAIISPE